MDIIKRKINLKPFTERVFGSESFIPVGNEQNEKTLDGIVSDVLYEGTVLSGLAADAGFVPVAYGNRVCMTCGEDFCDEEVSCHWEEPEPVIRWDTLVRHYRFLVNFIVESDYYRIGYREDTPRLVKLGNDEEHVFWQLKDYFNNAIGVYSDISSAMEDDTVVNKENCTKIVVINQNTEEFFRLFPDGIDSEKDFMNFISKAELSEPPFVEIPITLFSDTKDMGMYEVYCDYWKPGEEYSKGCVVYHDDESGSTFAYMYKGDTPSSSEEFNYGALLIKADRTMHLSVKGHRFIELDSEVGTDSVAFYPHVYFEGGYSGSSDERLKNIKEWDDRYDDLLNALDPILYSRKNDEEGNIQIGFSAQATQAALEELGIEGSGIVRENKDGYLGISYTDFIPLLVKRVKEQENRINVLEARLSALERRLVEDADT